VKNFFDMRLPAGVKVIVFALALLCEARRTPE
jgi:hypothetical protein